MNGMMTIGAIAREIEVMRYEAMMVRDTLDIMWTAAGKEESGMVPALCSTMTILIERTEAMRSDLEKLADSAWAISGEERAALGKGA